MVNWKRYNNPTKPRQERGHLMVLRTKDEAVYSKRLEELRSAIGSLPRTEKSGTAALFAERKADRLTAIRAAHRSFTKRAPGRGTSSGKTEKRGR